MPDKVSIVIAVGTPGDYILECIEHCLELTYSDYEIIVLPDEDWTTPHTSIRVVPTGKVRPSEKRDRGVEESKGEIIAFIDDDAWPVPDWLTNAMPHFDDPSVGAVGGPGMTPPDDGILQRISGLIYESPLVSGGYTYRYLPRRMRDVDDYPTSSLIIRKQDFLDAGGFDTGYWPGEDTILCLKLTHELGKRIVYDPEVKVYHHRRAVPSGHLRQIKSYALHRGFFARKFPETSLKISYFVPSLFTIFCCIGWLSVYFGESAFTLWVGVMGLYTLLALVFTLVRTLNPVEIAGALIGTFLTHITYGVWFILGLVSKDLHD